MRCTACKTERGGGGEGCAGDTIVPLPKETRLVFLFEALSDSTLTAAWTSHIREQPCYAVYGPQTHSAAALCLSNG